VHRRSVAPGFSPPFICRTCFMSPVIIAPVLAARLVTATISGVFGMAGALMMKDVLVSHLPAAISTVMHGFIQIVSNLSRSVIWRRQITWPLIGRYATGAGLAVAALAVVNWRPGQSEVLFLLGLTAMLAQAVTNVAMTNV